MACRLRGDDSAAPSCTAEAYDVPADVTDIRDLSQQIYVIREQSGAAVAAPASVEAETGWYELHGAKGHPEGSLHSWCKFSEHRFPTPGLCQVYGLQKALRDPAEFFSGGGGAAEPWQLKILYCTGGGGVGPCSCFQRGFLKVTEPCFCCDCLWEQTRAALDPDQHGNVESPTAAVAAPPTPPAPPMVPTAPPGPPPPEILRRSRASPPRNACEQAQRRWAEYKAEAARRGMTPAQFTAHRATVAPPMVNWDYGPSSTNVQDSRPQLDNPDERAKPY